MRKAHTEQKCVCVHKYMCNRDRLYVYPNCRTEEKPLIIFIASGEGKAPLLRSWLTDHVTLAPLVHALCGHPTLSEHRSIGSQFSKLAMGIMSGVGRAIRVVECSHVLR